MCFSGRVAIWLWSRIPKIVWSQPSLHPAGKACSPHVAGPYGEFGGPKPAWPRGRPWVAYKFEDGQRNGSEPLRMPAGFREFWKHAVICTAWSEERGGIGPFYPPPRSNHGRPTVHWGNAHVWY